MLAPAKRHRIVAMQRIARDQRHAHRHRCLERCVARSNRHRRIDRPRRVVHLEYTASEVRRRRRAHNPLPRPHIAARIVRGEPRQRAIEELRAHLHHRLCSQPQSVHHPRSEVLDHHIRRIDQPPRSLHAPRVLQIQHDASLAAVPRRVRGRIPHRPPRRVHLDHLGALIGQQHPRHWPGNVLPEIDHSHAIQRTHRDLHEHSDSGAQPSGPRASPRTTGSRGGRWNVTGRRPAPGGVLQRSVSQARESRPLAGLLLNGRRLN